jgi:serine phosphatase RsbU (regulator of sigma subunit)
VIGVSIEDWTWRSEAVLAAALSRDGVIQRPNVGLERLGGTAGMTLAELIEPSQHPALARRMAAADETWRAATFAFLGAPGRPAIDRRLWLAVAGGELLVVGEPLVDEQVRLVEKVLELNDELVAAHRERARLLEHERGIAETLQRALLPERLPEIPGLALTSHFSPAAGLVGGDWFDAVRLDSGELGLAIGDVAGKGIPAAALMGELRGGLRASVLDGGEPNEMLRRLDRLCDRAGHMATALVALIDPVSGVVRHASAGHLPPALIEPGGAVRFLHDGQSTPLLAYDASVPSARAVLPVGGRLVLYTDGLVERRREAIDESLARLAGAARFDGPLEELPRTLLTRMAPPESGQRDDIAIVAVERQA